MKNSKVKTFFRTFFGRGVIIKISSIVALLFILGAVLAPVISRYDPNEIDLTMMLQDPTGEHLLGCDAQGRDVFTRLLYGARISLLASVFSCMLAAAVGMVLGLVAGYYEKVAATLILRYIDIQLSIPPLLFTIIIGMLIGRSLFGLIVAIAFGLVPGFTRMMYGLVLQIKESDYIIALRLAQIPTWKILMFQLPTASWGNMVSDGYSYIFMKPLLAFVPGICITLTVVAFNIIGDSLRDALDPRLRGKL